MTSIISADTDDTAYWPVKTTSNWNSVYGEVLDLPLGNGDSVGMFDGKGNCYGVGLVKEGYYYLSAYSREEANPAIPGDFAIPGFREGDEVIFKCFKKSTNEEYVLMPADGVAYTYFHEGRYPPIRIDLVYTDPYSYSSSTDEELPWDEGDIESLLADEELPWDEGDIGSLWAGVPDYDLNQDDLEQLIREIETDLGELEKIEELPVGPEGAEKKVDTDSYDKYKSTDYYERESSSAKTESPGTAEPSGYSVDKSPEYIARTDQTASSKYISEEKRRDKETISKDVTAGTEAHSPETARALNKPVKKRLPVIPTVILICVIPVSIMGLLKLRRNKK